MLMTNLPFRSIERRGVSLPFLRLVSRLCGDYTDDCEVIIAGLEDDGLPVKGYGPLTFHPSTLLPRTLASSSSASRSC